MNKSKVWKTFVLFLVFTFLVSACGSAEKTDQAATGGEKFTTSSGFVCPEPATKMEVTSKELNLFVWTEYIPGEWKECFEHAYGVTINHGEYSSNEEMYAKLSSGSSTYDIVQPTDYIVSLMIKKGLLQKLDKNKLTVIKDLDPKYMNLPFDPGNEYTIPYEGGLDAIIYNSSKVTNPPTSYADLWKPEYAGKIVVLDDSRVVIGMTLLTLGYDVNTTDPAQLDEAKAKLSELMPSIKLFDSNSPKTALIAGDVDLGIVWTGEAYTANQEDSNFKFVYPSEGTIIWQDNYAIPVNAPHLDAVYAWLNYTMQGDMFYLMLRDFPYLNPNLAALEFAKQNHTDLYDPFMNSNITNPPAEAVTAAHQISDVGDATTIYDQIWTEVKAP